MHIRRNKPTLILRINGGIGNQLFQYAFGEAYRHVTGIPVVYDLLTLSEAFFKKNGGTPRSFELKCFGINPEVIPDNWLYRAVFVDRSDIMSRIAGNLAIKLKGIDFSRDNKWGSRGPYEYYADAFDPVKAPTFLSNYFQSYKFLEPIKDKLHSIFDIDKVNLSEPSKHMLRLIEAAEVSVSIHVRRGDYLKYTQTFSICQPDYYNTAIQIIKERWPGKTIKFFLFSDDLDYVRAVFKGDDFIFAEDFPEKSNHEDLCLMAHCTHNIIANSSYSWWGAWLNPNPGKLVVAPSGWSVNMTPDSKLIPDDWLIL